MKFILYNFSNSFGGQEKYLQLLTKELIKRKIPYKLIQAKPTYKTFFSFSKYYSLHSKDEKIIEILNGNSSLYFRAFLPYRNNVMRIYIQHSSFVDNQVSILRTLIRSFLFRILLRRVSFAIRICQENLPFHLLPGRIFTIYNGVDKINLDYPNKIFNKKKSFNLLMVGAVTRNKNHLLALSIISQLDFATLTIVGTGDNLETIKIKSEEMGIRSRVIFVGYQEDPKKYYLEADILLILSFFEGIPYVMLEGMSYGLPVISSNVGGIKEIISHMKTGILVDNFDINLFVKYIKLLFLSPKLYKSISLNARILIKDKFTSDKTFSELYKLILNHL